MNQLRALRSRLTYANVVATICLVAIVSGGTAVAATRLLTGADIKSSSLTGVDVKNSSLTGPDVKNASIAEAGLARAVKTQLAKVGATGPAGPAGTTGPAGARGVSAWVKIPVGTTVTGNFYDYCLIRADNDPHVVNLQLHGLPTGALNDVNFSTDDPLCTGTGPAPTAPAGRVCMYLDSSTNVDAIVGREWADIPSRLRGSFYVSWTDNAIAGFPAELYGSWAYTA